MKKIYPTIKGKYRFLGGWQTIPKSLMELVVGRGYEITPSGDNDYIIRGASKLIMIDEKQLNFYFEPFVDYFAEPEIVEEEGDKVVAEAEPKQEVKKPKKKAKKDTKKKPKEEIDVAKFLADNKEQLSLF